MARKTRRQGTVTSRDVAARAGVSPMTVSRTLRTPELVTVGTRERVESAARELAYVPDLAAGALSSQRSGHVAVLLPSLRHTGFLRTVDGLSDTLRGHGYHILIGDSYYSPDEQVELLRLVIGRRPEAIVLVASMDSDEARDLLRQSRIPVVETWGQPAEPLDMVVGFSQHEAGRAMTESLVEQGYTRIGYLAGPAHTDPYGEQRRLGHLEALAERGLDTSIHVVVSDTPMEIADGVSGVSTLRERYPEADALVCATDMTALGALSECQRRGWRVPEDIAIAGCGNFDFAASLNPSLTSVNLPSYTIGVRTAELIIARIGGEEQGDAVARPLDLGFEVVHRDSTRRKPSAATATAHTASPAAASTTDGLEAPNIHERARSGGERHG